MDNRKTNISELSEKVLRGLRKAFRKLVEISAANNEELVVGDKYGNFKSVPPKDLLKNLPEKSYCLIQSGLRFRYEFRSNLRKMR